MSTTPLPEHLRRFPCMHPWIGSRYRDERHKRLLVIGESHYLPPESTIHHDPARWYRSSQADLSEEEVRWASTIGNITGRWTRAHRIYRAIQDEIARILTESGITPDPFPLNHIAYCNYFLRPAPTAGGSMEGNECQHDLNAAEAVLRWFILSHCPELSIVTSRFAGRLAANALQESGIPRLSTPQPHTSWWNRAAPSYGNVRGRDLFCIFLRNHMWVNKPIACNG
ncbi:MAG: hypothetical protein OXC31_05980 [Spirochaetaceae bacterium]|nr:hypothetical protein [Spirochaetaceae bacterium]